MVSGAFKSFCHEHHFTSRPNETLMQDKFIFESPLGPLGLLANLLFLRKYMLNLLEERNAVIKQYDESEKWKLILP
jgi:ligand-binding SRPBCC domain-containing protein